MELFQGEYSSSLNSEDLHDPDLPMTSNKAKGGTLVMWKSSLDPYITVHNIDSAAYLPVILNIPGVQTSIHVALYLPTSGKETEFISELASLKVTLEELTIKYPDSAIFVRGDANSSKNNINRSIFLKKFCQDFDLSRVCINHNTYHHFLGQGASDSDLDVLLYSNQKGIHEQLMNLVCREENPLVDSHHDLILSVATIPSCPEPPMDRSQNITAPRVENTRQKIHWSREGTIQYEEITSKLLPELRNRWLLSSSQASISILIQSTNFLLSHVAAVTNRAVSLSSSFSPKSEKIPRQIRKSANNLAKANSLLKDILHNPTASPELVSIARAKYILKRKMHRQLTSLVPTHLMIFLTSSRP